MSGPTLLERPELERAELLAELGGAGGGQLGRHVAHDVRSRGYSMHAALPEGASDRPSLWWTPPPMDQARTTACTAYSVGRCAASKPHRQTIPVELRRQLAVDGVLFGLYRRAQLFDPWDGEEPTYYGTTGLAAAKALREGGYCREFRWAFTFEELVLWLGNVSPVSVGTVWTTGMDAPDRQGYLRPTGTERGGHQWTLVGRDPRKRRSRMVQSWGPRWGDHGRAWIADDDLEGLLARDGDALALVA